MWPRPRTSRPKFVKKPGTVLRSGLEDKVAKQLKDLNVPYLYEDGRIPYVIETFYKADFKLPNGIIIETKGLFESADRRKHRLIKEQHPELDIRFVFSNSTKRIGDKTSMTYGTWCDKMGFKYADGSIPLEWINEIRKK